MTQLAERKKIFPPTPVYTPTTPVVPQFPEIPTALQVYKNFTAGQRWGTYWLNNLIPGLGSYIIMQDWYGGTAQLLIGGAGYVCIVAGLVNLTSYEKEHVGPNDGGSFHTVKKINGGPMVAVIVGSLLSVTDQIINIGLSAAYRKPRPKNASLINPEVWNIAVLPGKDGIEQVSLSYTLRF